jgi:hypothetical protein
MALAKPPPRSLLSAEDRKWISAIRPVTSVDIRKQVRLALPAVVSSMSVRHEPAHLWEYSGDVRGVPATVSVNYASPVYSQLEYWVSTRGERAGLWGSNFERLMGLTSADWDLLEGANLEQSIAVLCDHVVYCVDLLQVLPSVQSVDAGRCMPDGGTQGDA